MIGRRHFLIGSGLAIGAASTPSAVLARGTDEADAAVVIRRGYTDCRYGQLHYLRGAPAEGKNQYPALILLHQNPSSSVEYEKLVAEMAKDREVIAFDTPGFGMSDWPPEPLDIAEYASAFSDGIGNLGLAARRPVDVYGYHTGTFLAAELAIAEPSRVGRVVMSGVPYRTLEERKERLKDIENGAKLTESGDEILAMERNLWAFVVTSRDKRVPLRRAAQLYKEKSKAMDRYWWQYKGVWNYEVKDRFPLIRQPLLLLQPHETLLQNSKDAAALVANSRVVELPDLDRDVFEVGYRSLAMEMRKWLV
jgi:pimeloyl-ACP methyl ester carboxylesterase